MYKQQRGNHPQNSDITTPNNPSKRPLLQTIIPRTPQPHTGTEPSCPPPLSQHHQTFPSPNPSPPINRQLSGQTISSRLLPRRSRLASYYPRRAPARAPIFSQQREKNNKRRDAKCSAHPESAEPEQRERERESRDAARRPVDTGGARRGSAPGHQPRHARAHLPPAGAPTHTATPARCTKPALGCTPGDVFLCSLVRRGAPVAVVVCLRVHEGGCEAYWVLRVEYIEVVWLMMRGG